MVKKCTSVICGAPNPKLFDLVTDELLSYLNQPGLTAESLFKDFSDVSGSFPKPELDTQPAGEWLSWKIPGWRNVESATKLAASRPADWADIMRVPLVGPDTFYDMFRLTLFRLVASRGVSLPILKWQGRESSGSTALIELPMDQQYFSTRQGTSGGETYVKTALGIPFRVDDDELYVFPARAQYLIRLARPKSSPYDPAQAYQASELQNVPGTDAIVNVTSSNPLTKTLVTYSRFVLSFDTLYPSLTIVPAPPTPSYWAWWKIEQLYNKRGIRCTDGTCQKFAFQKQEELEAAPDVSITNPSGWSVVTFYALPDHAYKVLGFSSKGIAVSSAIQTTVKAGLSQQATLSHTQDPARLSSPPPAKAFLQGDIIRQYQRNTNNCGTFSIALAASYWDPLVYNPLDRNGKWVEENHGDWAPGTFQGSMEDAASAIGYARDAATLDESTSRSDGLDVLKRYIAAGIPVIVNIDESQGRDKNIADHYGDEHYKVLVGYDDNKSLAYYKDDGSKGVTQGALYFANSGAKGAYEGDRNASLEHGMTPYGPSPFPRIHAVRDEQRENSEDYNYVPIGNDVDSYRAFWKKWKEGGIPLLTDSLWYLPFHRGRKKRN